MPLDKAIEPIVAHHFPDARLSRARRLKGGVSADVFRLDLEHPDGTQQSVVLRIHGATHEGLDAELEFALLKGLNAAGAPVARPILADTSGALSSYPFVLTNFAEGDTALPEEDMPSRINRMAQTLAGIHALPLTQLPPLTDRLDPRPELLGWLDDEGGLDPTGEYRATIAALGETRFDGAPSVLHGDFWPENIIWRDGEIASVVDWEDAAFGDPMSDVACTCLELRYLFGPAGAERFQSAYNALRPVDPERVTLWLAYVSASGLRYMGDWRLPAEREAWMRREATAALEDAMALLGATRPT